VPESIATLTKLLSAVPCRVATSLQVDDDVHLKYRNASLEPSPPTSKVPELIDTLLPKALPPGPLRARLLVSAQDADAAEVQPKYTKIRAVDIVPTTTVPASIDTM